MRKAITSQFEVATVVDGAQGPQGKPATVYSLVPSCTEIVRKKDGSTEPSGDVTCKVIKKTGDSAPEVVTTGFVIETEVDGRHYQSSTVPTSYVTTGILYELYIESKLMDSVTVPVVNDGENAAVASVTPDTYSVPFESDGTIPASVYFDVTFSLKAGTQDVTPSSITARSLPSAVSISGSGSSRRITIGSAARAADMSEPCVFRLTGTYGGKTYTADCTVQIIAAVKGQTGTGQTGHVGRFYYYAGEWSSSRTYYFEKNQAPYVKVVNYDAVSFYMLDFAAHSDIQQSDTTRAVDSEFEPTSHAGGDPWSLMSSEQQYYIAKAFFGEYAQFGGSIINGDYLLSQYVKAFGFGGTKMPVDDNTKYAYTEEDDMFGEGDMYEGMNDRSLFPLVQYNTNPYYPTMHVKGTSYTDSQTESGGQAGTLYARTNQFRFPEWKGNMYCVEIEAFAYGTNVQFCVAGNEFEANQGYAISGCSGTIQKRFAADDYYYTYFFFFTPPSGVSTTNYYRVYFKLSAQSGTSYYSDIKHIYIRRVKFVPNFCLDMLRGKLVANDIVARGELHAESLLYDSILANGNNNTYRITNESILTLNYNSMGSRVILPNPQDAKGRVIEIFSGIQDGYSFSLGYDAATTTTYFKCPMMGASWNYGLANYQSWNSTYLKLWCDGTYWYILKDEHTVWVNDQYGYRICLNNKYHSNV